jgi:SPP1 family predicted phage head-tail adaptor
VTLYAPSETRGAYNETIEGFTKKGLRWASKKDVSDGERERAAALGATVTTRFVVRWDSLTKTVTAKWRIACEGKTYDIVGAKDLPERGEGREFTATRRAD